MRLKDVLHAKGEGVETTAPTATIADLVSQLVDKKIGAVVVSSDGTTVEGIVSERDVVRAVAKYGDAGLDKPVSTIMTPTVQCATPDVHVDDLMSLMTNSRIRHVPILDPDNAMIGIVSIGDVVKSRLGELEHERDALVQYVTVGG